MSPEERHQLDKEQSLHYWVEDLRESRREGFASCLEDIVAKSFEEPLLTRHWVRTQKTIPPGHRIEYFRESESNPAPYVDLIGPDGEFVLRWSPARLFGVRRARPKKHEWYDSAIISVEETREAPPAVVIGVKAEAALLNHPLLRGKTPADTGRKVAIFAKLARTPGVGDLTMAEMGGKLGITKQAVSRRAKRLDQELNQKNGGRTTCRTLRSKPDPRKGMTLKEIKARKKG